MITVYEAHKKELDALAMRGGVSIREMAKRFTRSIDMDRELGFTHGTVRHWIEGTNNFARSSEVCAASWLKANPEQQPGDPAPAKAPSTGTMMLVVCDNATADRAKKMLALIGCEVTEV